MVLKPGFIMWSPHVIAFCLWFYLLSLFGQSLIVFVFVFIFYLIIAFGQHGLIPA